MKTEIKKILYKFLQDGITSDDAAQQVLDLFNVMKRISELEREYYNLEDDWLKDKSFKKLDRKYEIQKIFSELGISLKDWKKKFNENSKLYISDADTSDSFLTPEEFLIGWEGKDDSTHPNIDIRDEWAKRINQLKTYMELNIKTMSLGDLKQIKSILTKRLEKKEAWMIAERGHDYEEYCRREWIYHQDENHEKLKRVNQRIEDFINAV